jgi:hypothetical protein
MRWVASSEGTADHRPLAGVEGFSQTHTLAIVVAEVLNAVWMTWLLVVAWQMPHPKRLSPGR